MVVQIVELIPGAEQRNLRRHKPCGTAQRVGNALFGNEAVTLDSALMLETGGIEVRGELKAVPVTDIAVERDARHAFVRNDARTDGLILVDGDARIPERRVSVGQAQVLRQDGHGGLTDVAREVRDKIVVAHAVVINVTVPGTVVVLPFETQARARGVCFMVARQNVIVELGIPVLLQHPGFRSEHCTALCHHTRCEREVIVRCNVEVVRHHKVHTAARTHPERRNKEPGAALIADGEHEPGGAENGNAQKVQRGPLAFGHLVVLIDVELVEFDKPGLLVLRAGCDFHTFHLRGVAGEKADVFGAAAQFARSVFILRVLHLAGTFRETVLHRGTGEGCTHTVQAGIADTFHFVGCLSVGDTIAFENSTAAPDLGIADQMKLIFGIAFDTIR